MLPSSQISTVYILLKVQFGATTVKIDVSDLATCEALALLAELR